MAEEKALKQARKNYETLCRLLDSRQWHYSRHDEDLTITCGARGDDLPMDLNIEVDADRELIMLLSPMPFDIPEDRRDAMAVAVSTANYRIADGSFDYNYLKGRIVFRMTASYRGSVIGEELFEYLLFVSCSTIDEYNDKFLLVSKSNMAGKDIVAFLS